MIIHYVYHTCMLYCTCTVHVYVYVYTCTRVGLIKFVRRYEGIIALDHLFTEGSLHVRSPSGKM